MKTTAQINKKIKGYTLIELMIYVALSATALSSAIYGISNFYYNNFSHNALFSILENSRLLQESINHELKKAGYKDKPTTNDLNVYREDFGFKQGESIILQSEKRLYYRFYADPNNDDLIAHFDCTGDDLLREGKVYYVRIRHNIDTKKVTCIRYTEDEARTNEETFFSDLDPILDPVILADRIEAITFWAAMDDDDDNFADKYVRGNNFKDQIDRGDVVGIRYRFDVVVNDNVAASSNRHEDDEVLDFNTPMTRVPFDRVIYLRN